MLLKEFDTFDGLLPDIGCNSILHLTKTQTELAEKFTAAFYEAQACEKTPQETVFEEDSFDNIDPYKDTEENDYLLDFLLSKTNYVSSDHTVSKSTSSSFDYEEFSEDFDHQLHSNDYEDFPHSQIENNSEILDNQTDTFFAPSPTLLNNATLENYGINFSEFDLAETLSNASFDVDKFSSELCELDEKNSVESERLPPVTTITNNNFDFSTFLRCSQPTSLNIFDKQVFLIVLYRFTFC